MEQVDGMKISFLIENEYVFYEERYRLIIYPKTCIQL